MKLITMIKFTYHFLTCIFLFMIGNYLYENLIISYILYIISMIHFYDAYWFINHDENAPI